MSSLHNNLREFIAALKRHNQVQEIDVEVDPHLELAEIHRRVIENEGPVLFFQKVKGSKFPVVTNLFGTRARVDLAVGQEPEKIVREAVQSVDQLMSLSPKVLWEQRNLLFKLTKIGTKKVPLANAPVAQTSMNPPDITALPVLTSWPDDGGPFVTLPLIYTENPENRSHNLGMYRIQTYAPDQTGIHWQIQKGGGFHYHLAEQKNRELPVTLFIGGPPALILSAIAPLPENVPELLFASFLMQKKIDLTARGTSPHPLIAEAEFAVSGTVAPKIRRPEGPFGDHYGYYSVTHDFPVYHIKSIRHRKNAVYPATVVGKPRQEDYFIGEYLQSLLAPLFPLVMPGVESLWTYAETGFHALTSAVIRESYDKEALIHAFRILGEGQLSLTKFLILTNVRTDLRNFRTLLPEVLRRFRPESDLFIISDTPMDTLDYTGRKFNQGSKAVMLGLGHPIRELPERFEGEGLPGISEITSFCPGCLLISGGDYTRDEQLPRRILESTNIPEFSAELQKWPFIIIVDHVQTIKDQTAFLWEVFTRFSPGNDLYAQQEIKDNRVVFHGPVIIDARMKPFYPGVVTPDEKTVRLVDQRWSQYGIKL